MVNYNFKAKNAEGKTQIGSVSAENLNDFYAKLKEKNLFCISAQVASEHGSKAIIIKRSSKLKLKDLSIFCRQFATMMSAGLTVVKCLDILYRQAEKKKVKQTMLNLYETIKKGKSLSLALKEQGKAFPDLLISMVESGEASGTLDDVMLSMADHYEKEKILKNKISSAMIYPIVLVVVSIIVVIILLTKVIPTFINLFPSKADLPGPTKFLLSLSGMLTNHWYICIAVILAIGTSFFFLLKVDSVRLTFDKIKIKLPVFGKLMSTVITARFARTVASLYSSGVPIIESIKITSGVLGNKYIGKKMDDVINDIKQGVSFSKAIINANVFKPMFSSMIYIGEESGSLDTILSKTADFYDEDAQTAITKMVALLEPCMIVVLAIIIGFIVISIALPMFNMYKYIA